MPKVINRAKSNYDLEKVPEEALLLHANIEIGKLKSYIDELEYNIGILKEGLVLPEYLNKRIKDLIKDKKRLTTENRQLNKLIIANNCKMYIKKDGFKGFK